MTSILGDVALLGLSVAALVAAVVIVRRAFRAAL